MKSDHDKDATPTTARDVDRKVIEAEVVDAARLPQEWMTKPAQVPVASALTGKGAVKVARLHTEIAGEEMKAAELELRVQRAQAEAAKVRAETFALISEIVIRIKRLRREAEELTTQIEIELVTRDDKVRTAKAQSALERLRAENAYKIETYEAIFQRNEVKMRAASSSREVRNSRESAAGQLDADAQRNMVAWAEIVAVEAAEGNLDKPPVRPYGEFAAYYYLCARMREETHADAIVSTARTLINRRLVKPFEEQDEQRRYYAGEFNKLHATWRTHRQAVRTAEVQAILNGAANQAEVLQQQNLHLKLQIVERELELARLHYGAADAAGDSVYDREA